MEKYELFEYKSLFIYDSLRWVKYAILQGEHLLSYKCDSDIDMSECEEDIFVFALDRAIFTLKEATIVSPKFVYHVDEIENKLGNGVVKDIRDMRTHINEYARGEGKHPDRYRHSSASELPERLKVTKVISTARSRIIYPDKYLIGGRLNVQDAIKVLKKILSPLKHLCENERARLLCEITEQEQPK